MVGAVGEWDWVEVGFREGVGEGLVEEKIELGFLMLRSREAEGVQEKLGFRRGEEGLVVAVNPWLFSLKEGTNERHA